MRSPAITAFPPRIRCPRASAAPSGTSRLFPEEIAHAGGLLPVNILGGGNDGEFGAGLDGDTHRGSDGAAMKRGIEHVDAVPRIF